LGSPICRLSGPAGKGAGPAKVERCGICGSDLHARRHADKVADVLVEVGYEDFMRSDQRIVLATSSAAPWRSTGRAAARGCPPGRRSCLCHFSGALGRSMRSVCPWRPLRGRPRPSTRRSCRPRANGLLLRAPPAASVRVEKAYARLEAAAVRYRRARRDPRGHRRHALLARRAERCQGPVRGLRPAQHTPPHRPRERAAS
jgi:hypothetical protein